jgi:hypothetical protein
MIVSPFTPLTFSERKNDGITSPYIQTFATTDYILIEVISTTGASIVGQVIPHSTYVARPITWNYWAINDTTYLRFTELRLSPGLYSVFIEGIGYSDTFRVTDDQTILNDTTLIQYSMANNRQRKDAVFFIDGMQHFFDFRVPGGFQDKNWTFGVESEQFVTDDADIMSLYALESTQKKFTMGTAEGCPIWFGELLNRLLCCNYVYFDGVRYARKETSSPEVTEQLEGVNSFVFTQQLQQVNNLDPELELTNQALIRRLSSSDNYRVTDTDSYNRLIN